MDVAAQAKEALAELEKHITSRFPDQVDMKSAEGASYVGLAEVKPVFSPTGERYTEFFSRLETGKSGFDNAAAAADFLRRQFDVYAEGRSGRLYWRVKPEVEAYRDFSTGSEPRWKSYMRLLISDKPHARAS